jgi:hypothetical protein
MSIRKRWRIKKEKDVELLHRINYYFILSTRDDYSNDE